jgi:hypothetical protein
MTDERTANDPILLSQLDDANRLVADGWAVEGFASAGGSLYAAEGSGFVYAIDRATVRSFSSLSEPWPKRTRR